jgi:outer membrane protein OmpA-like peptidoglycan-associated protein
MSSKILFLFILFPFLALSQSELDGLWQGIIIKNGSTQALSNPFFIELKTEKGKSSGRTREEIYKTDFFAIGKQYGTVKGNEVTFKQVTYSKKEGNSRITWCKLEGKLIYNEKTGYLEGNYTSSDCRQNAGEIILFRTKGTFSDDKRLIASHSSRDNLIKDLALGLSAPEVREEDRKNFVFQPIYFDYDKAEIRSEYFDFLSRIVRVINGHTDLRVQVTGNTDADGSDAYNDDLSKRRAQAIIQYFVKEGISADRIEIEFNGEKKPIDRNDTKEGKQRNRRVEFAFI